MELVGLIILAVIAALLLLLLFTPLGVSVDYGADGLKLAARVMAFNLQLYPKPDRKQRAGKNAAPEKKKKQGKAKAGKPKKEKPPLVTQDMLPELLKLAGKTLSRFRRKLTVNRFVMHIVVAGEADPYNAVMTYGAINYAVATVGSAAGHAFNVKKSDIQTGMDFSAASTSVEAGITITISIARILAVAAAAGIGFLKIKRHAAKAQKAAAGERKENNGTDADSNG